MRGELMTTLYHVQKIDESGIPFALIPSGDIWGLMEYLSFQRVVVTYQYHASHFTVTFPRMDAECAQLILDEWVHAGAHEHELVPA